MKGDDWFRDDLYRPPDAESPAPAEDRVTGRRTAQALRVLVLTFVALTAVLMLYWLVQTFVCDFREAVFPDMPRRAPWLCR